MPIVGNECHWCCLLLLLIYVTAKSNKCQFIAFKLIATALLTWIKLQQQFFYYYLDINSQHQHKVKLPVVL